MKPRPKKILVVLLLCVIASLALFKVYSQRERDNVREGVVRRLTESPFPAGTLFITIDRQDPEDQFLRRFQGDSFVVKKQSDAIASEGSELPGRHWRDKVTGAPGAAIDIGEISWRGPFKAKVVISGGFASSEYTLVKYGTAWIVTDGKTLSVV